MGRPVPSSRLGPGLALAWALATGAGCGDPGPSAGGATGSTASGAAGSTAAAQASPTGATDEAGAALPAVALEGAEPGDPRLGDEQRQRQFEARATVPVPAELPKPWRAVVAAIGGRLTLAAHEVRSGEARAYRQIHLQIRAFGHDATIDQRLAAALVDLGLLAPGAPVPEAPVVAGEVTWSVEVGRLKAPEGRAREHRIELHWAQRPAQAADRPDCKRPPPVDPPGDTPAWVAAATINQSSRRRVSARFERSPEASLVTLRLLYQNGYAHDGQVGALQAAAEKAGFKRESGTGPRQRWQRGGESLSWRPDPAELDLGCTLVGPVLAITWARTAPAAP